MFTNALGKLALGAPLSRSITTQAWVLDASNTGITENDVDASVTFSHTTGTLTNGILFVWAAWATTATTITGITYNGVAMILAASQASQRGVALYYLLNPASGSRNVVISGSGNFGRISCGSHSWNGARSTQQTQTKATGSGSNGAPTTTPQVMTGRLIVDSIGVSFTAGDTLTVDADQTERGKVSGGATIGASSTQDGASNGVMSWTDSNNTRAWGAVSFAFDAIVVNVLTSTDITLGSPVVASPAVGQSHVLSSSDIYTSSPSLGAPAITQSQALLSSDISTPSPTLASPSINQSHTLSSSNIYTSLPSIGTPIIAQSQVLLSSNINTSFPTLGNPSLNQSQALSSNNIIADQPTLAQASINQSHTLSIVNIYTDHPILGNPSMAENAIALFSNYITTNPPILDHPPISQTHLLSSNNIVTNNPYLDQLSISQIHILINNYIVTGVPILGAPYLPPSITGIGTLPAIKAEKLQTIKPEKLKVIKSDKITKTRSR